jgi:hypothetical protein
MELGAQRFLIHVRGRDNDPVAAIDWNDGLKDMHHNKSSTVIPSQHAGQPEGDGRIL